MHQGPATEKSIPSSRISKEACMSGAPKVREITG